MRLVPGPLRIGGELLMRAMDLVIACRTADPDGDYPHVGDLNWWFRNPAIDDPEHWRLWRDGLGRVSAMALAQGGELHYTIHPRVKNAALVAEMRAWGQQRLQQEARAAESSTYRVLEEAAEDDTARLTSLEGEGYARDEGWHYARYRRALNGPVPAPRLPEGFSVRHIGGEREAVERAALQHEAFLPFTNKALQQSVLRYRRVMRAPAYDPHLDLVIVAPDGVLAAGCICWLDSVNHVGLFEPVGTRPAYRRRGLATALMLEGLRRLRAQGTTTALVTTLSPGDGDCQVPAEFTASRFIYEAVGFHLLRRVYRYHRDYLTKG